MKIDIRNILTLILLSLILYSCKGSLFYTNLYTRDGRSSSYFKKEYRQKDSIILNSINICKQSRKPPNKFNQTDGYLIFDVWSLENSLKIVIENNLSIINALPERVNPWNFNCLDIKRRHLIKNKPDYDIHNDAKIHMDVYFNIKDMTAENLDVDISGPLTYFDLGNDITKIEYKLIIALFHQDNLLYMDNQAYWTEVFSKRGEKLQYKVPQNIIDSLVTKNLAEYKRRLK